MISENVAKQASRGPVTRMHAETIRDAEAEVDADRRRDCS